MRAKFTSVLPFMRLTSNAAIMTATIAILALTTACSKESSDDQAIADGLNCLDKAVTTADADVCQTKVQGLTSQQSYLIRCSANFIAQGFTGSRIATAFQQQKNGSGASNQTTAMLSYFVFDPSKTNDTYQITYNNCVASGSAAMAGISSMIATASYAAGLAGSITGTNLDPNSPSFNSSALMTQLQTLYNNNDPTANATIGNFATTAQTSFCGTGSSFATQDVCTKLNSAIASGNGNAANVGRALLNMLKQ